MELVKNHYEEDYFAKRERELKQAYSNKSQNENRVREDEALKQLHKNHCSNCGYNLESREFKGIEICKCFNCGGVFLQDGELELLAGEESEFFKNLLGIFKT